MSCLSIFQATLSIRESAALAVNLRAASRLPAPPRRAAVSLTACSSPLLPAGRDAQPGSGRPCWDGLSWGAQHHPLCRCGRVVARGGQSRQPPVPVCRSNGDSPCTSWLPRSLGCGRCGLHEKGTQKSHQHWGTNTTVPQAPASHPCRPPGQRLDRDPVPQGRAMGPAEIPHGRRGESWPQDGPRGQAPLGLCRRPGGSVGPPPVGQRGSGARWTFPAGSELPAASGARRQGSAACQALNLPSSWGTARQRRARGPCALNQTQEQGNK